MIETGRDMDLAVEGGRLALPYRRRLTEAYHPAGSSE